MINNIIVQGRLTKEPDLKYTNSGTAVISLSLAVQRNFKNQNGEYEADFPMIQAWKKTAELIAQHFHKGDEILLQGRLQTRTYENQQGQKVFVTEIVADSFSFTSGRKQHDHQETSNQAPQGQYQQPNNQYQQSGTNQGPFGTINDSDLPF